MLLTWQEMIYNIVCVSDINYIQHTAVMLCSLFETNPGKQFCVHLLTDIDNYNLISQCNKSNGSSVMLFLQRLCKRYNVDINLYSCSLDIVKDLPVSQWNVFMYLKLFIPNVLPADVKRCLFLDADLVINDDIKLLYECNLGTNVIAATEDIPDCSSFKARLHLEYDDVYINSGVMVCDLEQWRSMQQQCDIISFAHSIASKIRNEQDVLAVYFRNKIKIIPIKWNMVTFYFMRVPKIFNRYLPQLKEARRHPAIIHFAAPIKPWFRDCDHPYKQLYKKYLKKTHWTSNSTFPFYEKLTLRQRINKRIKRLLVKLGLRNDPMCLVR